MSPITFTNEDFKGVDYRQQDDPMVIAVDIDRFTIRKTLVDQGSSVDILSWKTLRIAEAEMMPYDDHVVGFSGERVGTKGYIELYTTFEEGKGTRTIKIRYLVIDANTSYNILLSRPSINRQMVIVSPCNEVPFEDRGHSHGPRRLERSTTVLCREPPSETLKERHLPPEGEKILPKRPLPREGPTKKDRADRDIGRPRSPGHQG